MSPTLSLAPQLISYLRTELGFSKNASIRYESTLKDDYPIRFDLIIEDQNITYVVELKRIVQFEALSRIGFLKLLLRSDVVETNNLKFVIAGKRITPEAAKAAQKIGIRCIKLPAGMRLEEAHDKTGAIQAKLTSPKSWQVISNLLKMKDISIRQLSIKSGVSYGWTHATVRTLASKGIVSSTKGNINITNIDKLLNGIAWERPFERLITKEFRIAAKNPIELASDICDVCNDQRMPCAFTSFTAGEIYTGYSARHDSVYLYLEKKNIPTLTEMYEVETNGGIAVRVYAPDRDVFTDRKIHFVNDVWLVSPAQLLLDCAGLGYAGRDLTQKLVEIYDQL